MEYHIGNGRSWVGGFTLLELLTVLAIVSLLASLAVPRYWGTINSSREAVLKTNLFVIRDQIGKYYSDKRRYPKNIKQLVDDRYLIGVPEDPITQSRDTWIITNGGVPEGIVNIHSGAEGIASDGSRYVDW